ncbi:MAG: hypothetical protein SFT94_06240 [Pseudanabaenaceae cyanobacterium bins.68]|nr:hypothetical protein [Pseudanabaenaceae cyanobacterium bins.68]
MKLLVLLSLILRPAITLTKTQDKIYIQGLRPSESRQIQHQFRRPTSLKVDQCGNGRISTAVQPDLIEVQTQIIPVAKLPVLDQPVCGRSGQLKPSGRQRVYILHGLPVNRSLIAQLIVSKPKKVQGNRCGFATIKRSRRLVGYAEQNVETLYSLNGQLLIKIPDGKDINCRPK